MRPNLPDKLCCPIDKHDLEIEVFVQNEESGEILEALMTCPRCNRFFPVIYGIPIMIPDEYRDKSLEEPLLKKWGYSLEEGTAEEGRFLLEEKRDDS